jgi:AcrR family transcriptional regulator
MRAIAVREDIRELILDAAERLLVRYGYKKMTIDDIAKEVGIGKGTIYLHFNSKEEIALARIERVILRLKQRLRDIARGQDGATNRIREMLIMRVLHRFDAVQEYTESISDVLAAIRPGLLKQRERHFEEEAEIFIQVLNQGKRTGEFAFKDSRSTAHSLLLATNSLLPYSLTTGQLGKREEIKEKVSRIADLLLVGLLRRSAARVKAKPK